MNTRGILISGLPGVGKTTFLNYIRKKHFPIQMKIVSLAGRLGAVKPRDYVSVTEEQFLYIFSAVESFLIHILNSNNISVSHHKPSTIKEKWQSTGNKIPFKEFARDILLPLCGQINKLDNIPQYFLVIDDVDYIFPTDQSEILAVLCDFISTTSNPVILYSARPPAAGIAKNHLSTYACHHFGDPIDLDPIPAFDVVKDRLKDCDSKCSEQCGPFLCNTETKKFFLSLSNHNSTVLSSPKVMNHNTITH